MKRLVVVLSGLLVLPAFAEVAPTYYADEIAYSDAEYSDDVDVSGAEISVPESENVASVPQNARINARAAARATSSRTGTATRAGAVSPRSVSGRGAADTGSASLARAVSSRAGRTAAGARVSNSAGKVSQTAPARNAGNGATVARAGATTATAGTGVVQRASMTTTDTTNSPLYIGRVSTRSSSIGARVPAIRMASGSTTATAATTTTVSAADTVAEMDDLAQMTDYCKAQYTQCMDNFCNVLDDNQGRCSCSKNLKNYAKTEEALKSATEQLQDVAQKIQYIGLSGDDIDILFTQTEAELKMSTTTDNTSLKNDLDRIKKLIVDVKTGSASSISDTSGLSFDLSGFLDFNVSSTGFDLATLFGGGQTSANTSSISNQRGEQLYKTAAARCKAAVLNTCSAQGVDISVITNSYDLEIDKQCILYERALTDSNEQMVATVRNAKSVLQKARLMVAKQKNQYDLRGCINALDSCMQDDYVCGSDYENCLDPSGKYIVNGEVVLGSTPGIAGGGLVGGETGIGKDLYSAWNYNSKNAFASGSVSEFVEASWLTAGTEFSSPTDNMAKYLQQKIGYALNGKSYGMCMSVLNKCQDLTYENDVYNPKNDVVRNYLERVTVQIKVAQDNKLADYAEGCISDVNACLSQNAYSNLVNTTTTGTVSAIAVNACRAVISTCMSATGYNSTLPATMFNWLQHTVGVTVSGGYVESLSQVTNSAMCGAINGTWNASANPKCQPVDSNSEFKSEFGRYVCKSNYEEFNTNAGFSCVACGANAESTNGQICKCKAGFVENGTTASGTLQCKSGS